MSFTVILNREILIISECDRIPLKNYFTQIEKTLDETYLKVCQYS
ncbi:hypothetical protein ACE1CI_07015 [Aerosakkonemataceae cyanobacterium BLCC-F50]|uniref:Uncharacterized protein n=1 Tax=Floridaenema flaviceps BLCC-F50 TaxID=3153642 RepID=A0ABV4XLW0_9CYAN